MRGLIAALVLLPGALCAAEVTAARTLPAGTVITPGDVMIVGEEAEGQDYLNSLIGLETRVTIYEGKPIRAAQLTAARLIDRNQLVKLVYLTDALRIETEGRALSAGALGETIRVMNLASKTTVSGMVAADGTVTVQRN